MKLDVSKVMTQNQAKQKNNYDGRTKLRKLQFGSNVLVKNFQQGPKWIKGTVKEKVGPLSYMIELLNGMVWKCHIDHLGRKKGEPKPQIEPHRQQDVVPKDKSHLD